MGLLNYKGLSLIAYCAWSGRNFVANTTCRLWRHLDHTFINLSLLKMRDALRTIQCNKPLLSADQISYCDLMYHFVELHFQDAVSTINSKIFFWTKILL
jgi:hypothetical protein